MRIFWEQRFGGRIDYFLGQVFRSGIQRGFLIGFQGLKIRCGEVDFGFQSFKNDIEIVICDFDI